MSKIFFWNFYAPKELIVEEERNDDCFVFEDTIKIRIYWFRKRESSSPPKKGKQPKARIFLLQSPTNPRSTDTHKFPPESESFRPATREQSKYMAHGP
jgi:hypothetical protein